jgi:glycosyltransferase involved in cell wall biosynthesis
MSGASESLSRSRRVRVCIVAPSMDVVGGQSIQAALLLSRLRQLESLDVRFVPVNPRLSGIAGRLQRVRYVRTVVTTFCYLWSLLRVMSRVDVVHAFSASYFSYLLAPLPAILVARLFGRVVLLNYHSGEADDHLRNWPISRSTMRLATRILVPSPYLADVFARYRLSASVIPNFIELGSIRWRARRALRPRFFTNRGFEAHYNVANVLRAYARIERERPDAQLTVAGDGPQRSELERLATSLGLRNVSFTGRVDPGAMAPLYDDADIFLNGSSIDNMPVSILECHAAGLPVVSTSAGGIPVLIEPGKTGLLVPLDDSDALAAAALEVLGNPDLAERLSMQGREQCLGRYTWNAVWPLWETIYLVPRNDEARHRAERGVMPNGWSRMRSGVRSDG